MPVCCAPGCSSGYASQPKGGRHFFKPPREHLQSWENALGRENFHLTEKSSVCDLHFDSSQISKLYEHQIGGQTVFIPRGKWLLKKNAIPCLALSGPFSKRAAQSAAKGGKAFAKRTDETPGTSFSSQAEHPFAEKTEETPGTSSCSQGEHPFAKMTDEIPGTSSCSQAEHPSLQASEFQTSETEEGGGDNSATFHLLLSQIEGSKLFDNWLVDTTVEQHIIFAKLAKKSDGSVVTERAVVLKKDLTLTIGEHKIDFKHYKLLYEADGGHQVRAVPKLTKEHVDPDNLRKMNVKLAVQLFSRTTALGLSMHSRLKYPGLEDCAGTTYFTALVNDLFDALNAKLPVRGVKEGSEKITTITEFLELVNITEQNNRTRGTSMFASQVTMESLRVTLASARDLITDLLGSGAEYVLTGKLNQDPLERFFGMIRSFGGDEDHPTIISFSHIYRLLSLYTPMKACIQGSVTGESTHVLATMEETMREKKKDYVSAHDKVLKQIETKLAQICDSAAEPELASTSDHNYYVPSREDCIIYYLCGYVVYSLSKHTKCTLCLEDVQSTEAHCPEAWLTLQKEYKQGSLKHPSHKMFVLFKSIERQIASTLEAGSPCGETFWIILDALDGCQISRLGCKEHQDSITKELLMSYITLRVHFFVKDTCKKLSASEKVATARKKAKLL
ncbi:hypothetical protein ISCGN_018164 [Ixodes scapularis]